MVMAEVLRAGNEVSQSLERPVDEADGAGLDEDVAQRCCLDGAGDDGHARAVGGPLAQEFVHRPAADDVDDAERC